MTRELPQHLDAVLKALREAYGKQDGWWPQADGPIEVCVGAILVQHTTWASAARAIEALRAAGALDCHTLLAMPEERLAELVRPAGTYHAKARTLREFARAVVDEHEGRLEALLTGTAEEARARLLRIRGIGAETADAIVLYAAHLPAFVVDAYAVRLFVRLGIDGLEAGWGTGRVNRERLRGALLAALGSDVARLQEAHALIVEHGRRTCLARGPWCHECALRPACAHGRAVMLESGGRSAVRRAQTTGRRGTTTGPRGRSATALPIPP